MGHTNHTGGRAERSGLVWAGLTPARPATAPPEESQCLTGFSEELGGSQISQEPYHRPQFAY